MPWPCTISNRRFLEPHWAWIFSEASPSTAARTVLPDVLRYDRSRPAAYPNGRALTDDAFSARMAFLSYGKAAGGGLPPHGDLLAEFPYLGPPVPYGTA